MADPANKATIEGLASVLSTSSDVSVRIDGAIVKIAGTELQVFNVARAIEAVVRVKYRVSGMVSKWKSIFVPPPPPPAAAPDPR